MPVSAELTADCVLPTWFERGLMVVLAGVIGFGGGGLLLADLGHYTFWRAAPIGIVFLLLGVVIAARYRRADGSAGRRLAAPSIGMCVVAAASMIGNGRFAGQDVRVARDPGVYAQAGKWIAAHGNLAADISIWSKTGVGTLVGAAGPGMYPQPNQTLQFQFAHMLPALMAEADYVGGNGLLFRAPAVVGALALCMIFAVGCRITGRPWLTLAAVTGLGVSLPQLSVSRDAYSETLSELLLWGSLWLLLVAWSRSTSRGAIGVSALAGAAMGATFMAHVDAPAYLIFLPLLAALAWLSRRDGSSRHVLINIAAFTAAAIPPAVLGIKDVQDRSAGYYGALRHEVLDLWLAFGLVLVGSAVLVVLWPRVGRLRTWLLARRARIGTGLGWVVGVGLLLAWTVRPSVQVVKQKVVDNGGAGLVAALQKAANVPSNAADTYSEHSLQWFSWYLGPVAVALGITGLAILIYRYVTAPSTALVLIVPAGLTSAYLWNVRNSADQIWVMRRFVPASLPLFAIAAALATGILADLLVARFDKVWGGRYATVALGLALLLFPLGATIPVRSFRVQAGFMGGVQQLCGKLGPHAAVVFPYKTEARYIQTLPTWCGVPAATFRVQPTEADIHALASGWKAQGYTLWIVAPTAELVSTATGSNPQLLVNVTSPHDLEVTLIRPPQFYLPTTMTLYGAPVAG